MSEKTKSVKIIGAGSIGNHLAQACRRIGWDVIVVDNDKKMLNRMKNEIYPSRYGTWDESIQLFEAGKEPKGGFDVICIGTPPHAHLSLALEALKEKPKVLQVEKPFAPPDLKPLPGFLKAVEKSGTMVCVGYDHVVSKMTRHAENLITEGRLGVSLTLDAEFRVHWGDIFAAHPWLTGPSDSYLGFIKKGGGASGEHSHALNLWQHFAHVAGQGSVVEISAAIRYVKDGVTDYDDIASYHLRTKSGFFGRVVQDVVTKPHRQIVRLQGSSGYFECRIRGDKRGDVLAYQEGSNSVVEQVIEKTRPDDFFEEITHIEQLLKNPKMYSRSPMALERGLDTLLVLAAGHVSAKSKHSVKIRYDRQHGPQSLLLA